MNSEHDRDGFISGAYYCVGGGTTDEGFLDSPCWDVVSNGFTGG